MRQCRATSDTLLGALLRTRSMLRYFIAPLLRCLLIRHLFRGWPCNSSNLQWSNLHSFIRSFVYSFIRRIADVSPEAVRHCATVSQGFVKNFTISWQTDFVKNFTISWQGHQKDKSRLCEKIHDVLTRANFWLVACKLVFCFFEKLSYDKRKKEKKRKDARKKKNRLKTSFLKTWLFRKIAYLSR